MRPPLAGPPTSGKSIGGGTASWDGRVAGAAQRLGSMVLGLAVGSFPRVAPRVKSLSGCDELKLDLFSRTSDKGAQVHLCGETFGNYIRRHILISQFASHLAICRQS